MNGIPGKAWIRGEEPTPGWLEAAGLPALSKGAVLGADSCVVCLGTGGWKSPPRLPGAVREPRLMNGAAGAVAKLSQQELERRLTTEGIASRIGAPMQDGQASSNRRFSATVFDLETTDVRRVYPVNSLNQRTTEPDETIRKIVARAASRALYCSGLDFGQVETDLDERGRPTVVSVSAEMKPSAGDGEKRTADAVASFALAWADETSREVSVLLGADPEFVLVAPDGKVVSADRYFPPDGSAGCDSVVVRGVRVWPLAELRPSPAAEPGAVAAELRRLLAAAARRTAGRRLTWRAGAGPVGGLPLGGHVHLSGAALTGERLRALDNVVALPLRLLEPESAASRRPRYGALGDYRRQSHGGFEYRTPPSWLVSPRLAHGVLALAKVAAEHSRELAGSRPLDDVRVREAFYSGDRTVLTDAARTVHKAVGATAGYAKYKAYLDGLFGAVFSGKSWNEAVDIRTRWGIPID